MRSKNIKPFGTGIVLDLQAGLGLDQRLINEDLPLTRRQRVGLIAEESMRAIELLHEYECDPFVSVFGSARVKADSADFELTEELGYCLGTVAGVNVMEGGGPGHMEAVKRGVLRAGKKVIRNNIVCNGLFEGKQNFVEEANVVHLVHSNLYSRKFVFLEAEAFIFRPGGLGTLDEESEVRAAVQLGILSGKPIFFVGEEHFSRWRDFLRSWLETLGYVNPDDLLVCITDDIHTVVREVRSHCSRKFPALVA